MRRYSLTSVGKTLNRKKTRENKCFQEYGAKVALGRLCGRLCNLAHTAWKTV